MNNPLFLIIYFKIGDVMKEKILQCGLTKITVHQPEQPNVEDLKHVYDVINELAGKVQKEKGIDISNLFYTSEDVMKMKKDSNYLFLKSLNYR